jgi:hypothetical protein
MIKRIGLAGVVLLAVLLGDAAACGVTPYLFSGISRPQNARRVNPTPGSVSSWLAVGIVVLSFKTEVAKESGSVRTSIESLRTAIERAKLWMVVTGAGTILSVWGAAVALARFLKQ